MGPISGFPCNRCTRRMRKPLLPGRRRTRIAVRRTLAVTPGSVLSLHRNQFHRIDDWQNLLCGGSQRWSGGLLARRRPERPPLHVAHQANLVCGTSTLACPAQTRVSVPHRGFSAHYATPVLPTGIPARIPLAGREARPHRRATPPLLPPAPRAACPPGSRSGEANRSAHDHRRDR